MATWFYAPDFRFSSRPSVGDARVVPAYFAQFGKPDTPGLIVKLCVLHDDELAAFPYRPVLAEANAVLFGKKNDLQLIGRTSYGFVSRADAWIRYRCERPQWQRFTFYPRWNGWPPQPDWNRRMRMRTDFNAPASENRNEPVA